MDILKLTEEASLNLLNEAKKIEKIKDFKMGGFELKGNMKSKNPDIENFLITSNLSIYRKD
jgi:hypothetical protein